MSNTLQLTLEEVTNQLPEVIDRLEREDFRVVIIKDGQPAAVVLSVDELESIEETLAVLSSPDLMGDIDAARVELDANTATPMNKAEAIAVVRRGMRAIAFPARHLVAASSEASSQSTPAGHGAALIEVVAHHLIHPPKARPGDRIAVLSWQ